MSENTEFDMSGALDTISSDLFGDEAGGAEQNDVELDVTLSDTAETTLQPSAASEGEPETTDDSAPLATETKPAPSTWRKEAQADWDKLPETVKAEVLKREEDMFRGLESYKQDANFGKSVTQALSRYMPVLQQYNINPVAQIAGLMEAHHTLAFGAPQEKQAFLQKIAADYGIDLGQVAAQEAPFTDPQVKSLMEQVKTLESKLSSYETDRQTTMVEKTTAEINAFLADPAYPYATELATDMAQLIKAGVAKDLKGAYEKALWQNPVVREKHLAKQQKESSEQAKLNAAKAAEAAKKAAAANVTTTSKKASRTAPVGTMDDTLQQTLAAINERGSK